MPPVKTYTRKSSVNRSRIEIVNSFMYQNNPIKKRKNKHKKKIVIQDLPARTTQCMLTNSFLDVKVDDTFDRLFKEYKKDQPEPVNEPKKSANKTPNITVENCSYSPIMTRHRSLTLSRSNNSSIEKDIVIQDVNKSSKSEASNSKVLGKERTLDRSVTNSLYIEKVKPKGHSTINLTEIINNAKMSKNTSCKMMFSDSFKKKYRNNLSVQHNTVISSTPIVDINRTDISVAISPIKNITNENLDVNSIVMFKTPKNVKRRPVRRISVANPSITKSVLLGSSNYDKSGISKDIFHDSSNIRVLKDVSNVTCDSIVKNDNQSAINENLNDYNEDLKGFESTDCNLLDSAHYLHLKEAISLMEKTLPESNSKCAITESKIETSSQNDNTDCILINNTKTQNSINTCDLQQSLKDIHFSSFEDIKSVSNLESTSTNKKYLDQTKNTTNSEKSSVANIDSASRDLLAFHRYITLRKRRITIKPYIKKRRKNRGGISGNDSSYWENSGTSFCKTLDSEIVNSGYICENGTNGQSVYDNEKSITDENSISIDTSKEQSLESTNETDESNLDHSKLERLAVNEDISMDDGNSLDQTDLDHTKLGREAVVEITSLNQSVYDNEKSITDVNGISIDTSKEQSLESTNETDESNLDHSKLERPAVNEDISMDDGNSLDQTDLDHTKLGREAVVEITSLNQSVYDNEKSITDVNGISIDTSKEQSLESTNETNESNLDHSKLERLAVNEDISMDDGNSLDQTDLDHTKLGREAVVEITPLNLELYIKQSEPKANSKQIMLNDLTSMESTNLGNETDESDLDHSKLERLAVNEDISMDDGNSLDQIDLDHTKLGREAIVEVTSLNLEMYIKQSEPKANSKQIMLNDPKLRQDPVVYVQCLNLKKVIPAGHSVDFTSPDVESKRSKSLDISSESELDHSAKLGSSANTTEDTSHSAKLRSSANTTEVTSHCIRTRSKTLKDEHRQAEQSQTNSRNLHEQRDSLDVSLTVPVSDSPAAAYEQKGQTFKKDITQLKGRSAKSIVIVSPDVEIPKNEGKSEAVSRGHTETRESDIQLRKLTRSRASTLGRSSRSIDIVSPDIEIPENEGKSVSATPPIRPLTKSRVSKKSKVSQRNAQRNLVLQTGLGAPIRDPDDQNKVFLTPKIPRRRTQRKTTLATLDESLAAKEAIMRSCKSNELTFKEPDVEDLVVLKPGKLWRRSLLEVRNSRVPSSPGNPSICVRSKGIVCTCIQCKRDNIGGSLLPRRLSVRVVPLSPISPSFANISYLENYAVSLYPSYVSDGVQESALEDYIENLSLNGRRPNPKSFREQQHPLPRQSQELGQRVLTARDVVLRKCKQTEPLPFQQCYPNSMLQHCQKIGEGVYGEVFLFRNPNGGITVMKIIPIEGSLIVNGERQKKYEEILSEITITMELSNLRNNVRNNTNGFAELQKVTCVRGKYPDRLLELWDLYEESHGTENESPEVFEDDQLYIILELANGGKDMEAFVFNNAQQAFALFQQIACALAVAEASLEFEHRDLHWGNLLISNVDAKKTVTYYLNGKRLELDTKGVQLAIIDYTLSRIKHEGICIYNDLSLDPDLFNAKGDYQFDIYRLMRECNKNDWQIFQPYTNVLWLHYVLSKMIAGLRYKNKNSKVHKEYLKKLQTVKDEILGHKSAQDFVTSWILLDND